MLEKCARYHCLVDATKTQIPYKETDFSLLLLLEVELSELYCWSVVDHISEGDYFSDPLGFGVNVQYFILFSTDEYSNIDNNINYCD